MVKSIVFASMYKIDDKLAWSGTNKYIYDSLCSAYNVRYIYVHSFVASIIRRFFKLLKNDYYAEYLYSLLLSKKFDLLISSCKEEYIVCICASEFLAYSNTEKKIIYISDSTYHLMFDYYMFNLNHHLKDLYDSLEKRTLNKSYKIVYSSNWVKDDAVNYYGIDERKVIVSLFGSNIDDQYQSMSYYRKIGYEVELLIVGVDYYRKGIDVAMKATKYLCNIDKNHKYGLNVVGIDKKDLKKCLSKEDYSDSLNYCKFFGKLYKNSKDDLNKLIDLYQSSHLFILPTRAECAGIVFSESSMFAMPIITRNTGGVKDYVKDGINGFVLGYDSDYKQFASTIYSIVNDTELYLILQKKSRELYKERMNWDFWLAIFNSHIDETFCNGGV